MKWEWYSRKGMLKEDNRDAGGMMINQSATVALLVDGSSKGSNGGCFVNLWVKEILNSIKIETIDDCSQIIDCMRHVHNKFRLKFISERACYSALVILNKPMQVWCINCGDCRIGKYDSKKIVWLTEPHRLDGIFENSVDHSHIVTKCLKSNRFIVPDIIPLNYSPNDDWILASDGYWLNTSDESEKSEHSDDRSYLRLSELNSNTNVDSDTNNWHLVTS